VFPKEISPLKSRVTGLATALMAQLYRCAVFCLPLVSGCLVHLFLLAMITHFAWSCSQELLQARFMEKRLGSIDYWFWCCWVQVILGEWIMQFLC